MNSATGLDALLIISNIAFIMLIPWVWLIAKRRSDLRVGHWAWEISFAFQLSLWSCFNHACSNPDLAWCIGGTPVRTLVVLDIINSLMMVWSTVAVFLEGKARSAYLPLLYPFVWVC